MTIIITPIIAALSSDRGRQLYRIIVAVVMVVVVVVLPAVVVVVVLIVVASVLLLHTHRAPLLAKSHSSLRAHDRA